MHKVCLALTVVINLFNRVKEQCRQLFSYEERVGGKFGGSSVLARRVSDLGIIFKDLSKVQWITE